MARPDMMRWENSTRVATCSAWGTTWPLHSGQWLPQPAPEPVARTNAPHSAVITFQINTNQANLAKRVSCMRSLRKS